MPQNKRQHFLAKQHMQRWSKTGRSLSVLDKQIPKVIELVSIRNTGQQDHYYEKEPVGVEAALGILEGQMSQVTDRIHQRQSLPTLEEEDRFTLRTYASTQLVRKEQAAGPLRNMLKEMGAIGRVAAGGCPPAAPTDPGVPNSGTRLLG